jgi:hypothetical protein
MRFLQTRTNLTVLPVRETSAFHSNVCMLVPSLS